MKHYFSFSLMVAGVKNILIRFPFSAIIAMIGTLLAIALTYEDLISKEIYSEVVKSIYICALAIPLFISIRLYLEASVYKPLYQIFIKIMALLLLGAYYWQVPAFLNNEFYIQFFFTIVALQLTVTFIGFLNFKYTNDNVVWQFNKILILRFLGASFATLILFAGLALALVAMDVLLEFNIDEDNYLRLWIFLSGVFFTYFFLAGITEVSRISSEAAFPNSLKIFLLYVIIPLLIVFSLILNLYLLKIIISWNIPKGWVIYLVSGYFALGLGASILLFPLRNIYYNKIFNFFKYSFFYTTLPFIIVYFVAVIIRVQQYGFTENRLIALILGAWMGFINLYFLFYKNYRLVIIPLSLTIMMLIAVYGPWSIFRISEYNQRGELLKVFKENKLIQNGKAIAAAKPVEKYAALRIIDILDYFNKKERMTFLQPLFYQNLDSLFNQDTFDLYNYKKDALLKILNISEKEYYSNNLSFNFYSESNQNAIDVKEYSHLIDFQESSYAYDDTSKWSTKIIISGSDSMVLLTNLTTATIKFVLKDIQETISLDAMVKQCDSITKEKPEYAQQIPESQMTIFHQSESVKLKFIFSSVYGYHTDSVRYVLQHISGKLLYLKK